jgi:hypothetical protein
VTGARIVAAVVAAAAAAALALSACGKDAPAEHRLLVIDGIEIRLADVEPYVAFFETFWPESGPKSRVQRALDEVLIPIALARRSFAKERAELKARADALCSVATNVLELEQQKAVAGDKLRSQVRRTHLQLPIALFAFDPLLTGSVSPPIEMPEGWRVVAAYDINQSSELLVGDYVDLLQVAFVHHSGKEWAEWCSAEKHRIADLATFVHPDYTTAMPEWIRQKKQS